MFLEWHSSGRFDRGAEEPLAGKDRWIPGGYEEVRTGLLEGPARK